MGSKSKDKSSSSSSSSRRSKRSGGGGGDDTASIRSRASHRSSRPSQPQLRAPSPTSTIGSRYSLREQFAMTRSEFEFGFDDASVIEPAESIAETIVRDDDSEGTVMDESHHPHDFSASIVVPRDYYELLCLPKGADLSEDELREAAYRFLQIVAINKQPSHLRSTAAFYLGMAHSAVETLREPTRRLGYDLSEVVDDDSDSEEAIRRKALQDPADGESYESRLHEQYLLLTNRESRTATDLSFRVDASPLIASGSDPVSQDHQPNSSLTTPTLTITGSAYGLLDEPFQIAPLFLGRYQPPSPSTHGRRRIDQLLASRFVPLLSLNLRQELSFKETAEFSPGQDLVVEQEIALLPQPSATTRVGYSLDLENGDPPLNVEVSVRKLFTSRASLIPSLGLAAHQRIGHGIAFFVADVGDWGPRTPKDGLTPVADVFRNPATIEVGYAFGRDDLGMQFGQAFTKPAERGLASLDYDLDERKPGSWTVSTGFTLGVAAAYLRYGLDILPTLTPATLTPTPRPQRRAALRGEAELAATTYHGLSLSLRALKPLGRFSKAGLEVSFSPSNTHLAFYWSRLGQRISLPFLVAPALGSAATTAVLSARVLFYTAILPFTALAGWEMYQHRRRINATTMAQKRRAAQQKQQQQQQQQKRSNKEKDREALALANQEKRLQASIARRRAEADELTVVLATGVEPRQIAERKRGGLVILSAKYGAPGDQEVADVTVAIAALVDDRSRLYIPAGLRKSRLPGFWDPSPGRKKVLRVRYLWQGREGEVEVSGREELRLP
ncbi:uncharacterized protein C8A04DRAFT_13719 [Dichotomopilus funicola]|uniref:DnaJ-like protein C11 C-terminal domain-containing protein n=1 Tax=Dichotomopilus funicola TaxID=1934379 RepID=A0AAN6ZLN9_9PEZI|nr:hypothetical protein C8A04DRAFT_13719 [Dichotomopilus funicola]